MDFMGDDGSGSRKDAIIICKYYTTKRNTTEENVWGSGLDCLMEVT